MNHQQLTLEVIDRFDLPLEERLALHRDIVDGACGFLFLTNTRTETYSVHSLVHLGVNGPSAVKVCDISDNELDELTARIIRKWTDALCLTWDDMSPALQRTVRKIPAVEALLGKDPILYGNAIGFTAPPVVVQLLS